MDLRPSLAAAGTFERKIIFEIFFGKRPGNPFLPGWIVLGPVYSGLWTFSGEVVYERAGAGLA
jgi:hypothetical protein